MDPDVAPRTEGSLATVPASADPSVDDPAGGSVEAAHEGTAPDRASAIASILVALLAFTIPLATATIGWSAPGGDGDWTRSVATAPFDLVLVAVLVWGALTPRAVLDLFRRRAVALACALYAVWFVVAFAAHPGPLGFSLLLRLGAGLAVIAVVAEAVRTIEGRRLALGALVVSGVLQAVLGMVQAARGEAFGIELIDYAGPLYPFGSSFAGRGGLTHPYHLAVFLVACEGAALLGLRATGRSSTLAARAPWLVALAVLGAGIAVTYTRAGAIGQVALLVALVLGRRDRPLLLAAAGALVVGLAVGGFGFGDGWYARGQNTTGADGASADSDRSVRLQEARGLIEEQPIVGVGPGRYVQALAETDRDEYLPAHNVVAHEAAELGVVGGLAVLGLLALLGLRILRGGAWTGAVVVPMVPFLLLDAYPYVFATGLAISALWLGLARASLDPVDPGGAIDVTDPQPVAVEVGS